MSRFARDIVVLYVGFLLGISVATLLWAGIGLLEQQEYAKGLVRLGPGLGALVGSLGLGFKVWRRTDGTLEK